MTAIESEDYEVIRQRLVKDPIVIAMAKGLANVDKLTELASVPR